MTCVPLGKEVHLMTTRRLVSSLVLAALLSPWSTPPARAEAADPAVDAMKAWLALVDAAKYDQSWDAAGAFFQRAVTKAQWSQSVGSVRGPLGAVGTRKIHSRDEATSLPGAPDGRYVVAQFETSFAHKAAAVETVTVSLEADGKWRVVGYYVR
jgi:hypothetical protein